MTQLLKAAGYTTFSLPEIIDADAIQDVDRLRALLHRENREHVFRTAVNAELSERYADACEQLARVAEYAGLLIALVRAHRAGDARAVRGALDALAEEMPRQESILQAAADAARLVH